MAQESTMLYNPFSLTSVEARAGRILTKLDVSAIHVGFDYLCIAIAEVYRDPSVAEYVTKTLVPRVSKISHNSPTSVHRSISRALSGINGNGNTSSKTLFLGSADAPTDIRFVVSKIAEFLHLEDEGKVTQ